jgi:hypothetical protein
MLEFHAAATEVVPPFNIPPCAAGQSSACQPAAQFFVKESE